MKLRTPSWKTAWYEEGLSERFAQEMTRIERTVVKDIETSAQWVEQLVIELGMLAQNMIHLEGEARRDSQIRLAFEKALKVSALSAHLMGALDQAVDRGPSLLRYGQEEETDRIATNGMAAEPPTHAPVSAPKPAAPQPAATMHTPVPAAPATPQPGAMRTNAAAQIGIKRQAAQKETPVVPGRPLATQSSTANEGPLVMSPLMDVSDASLSPNGNPMREMILSLSRRGLSRSEIEVITEQPRHVIEAVLAAG
ncbi:MAG TPA: hypothetical protein VF678_07390 [bacterium]